MENNFDFNSEEMQRVFRLERLESDFYELEKITDKWGFLRQIYMELLPWIMERAKENVVIPIIPYPINWGRYFSPIEQIAWGSIRSHYMALYPQFPVFNYFIDFANPYLRIGLELDGKEFHDPVKDKVRDELLYNHGWRIFRVKGAEVYTKYKPLDEIQQEKGNDSQDEDYNEDERNWMMHSCDGVIKAIKIVYFLNAEQDPLYNLACDTLHEHRLAEFPLFREDDEDEF